MKKISPIILYTHNRSQYLDLTLNSIIYSVRDNPDVEIHVFMVNPTQAVKRVCIDKIEKFMNVKLYHIYNNVSFAAINIAIQHIKSESFIIWEDDFIIPQYTRHLIPRWNSVFTSHLEQYDMVSFTTSIENIVYEYFRLIPDAKNDFLFHNIKHITWFTNPPESSMTINGLAIKTIKYIEAIRYQQNEHWSWASPQKMFFATDAGVSAVCEKKLYSSIRGYHIGFNQEMDGFPKIHNRNKRFPHPNNIKDSQKIYDYQNNTNFIYNLSDILR